MNDSSGLCRKIKSGKDLGWLMNNLELTDDHITREGKERDSGGLCLTRTGAGYSHPSVHPGSREPDRNDLSEYRTGDAK